MYCGKCGKVNTDGIRFCIHCGSDMAQQTPQPVNPLASDETIEDTDALRDDIMDAGRTPGTRGSRGSDSGDVPHAQAASIDALKQGRMLVGRYKILGRLGVGGMGEVFKAADSELDGMEVAVKVLPPLLASNTRGINRLRTEAAIALKLTHPNICRLHTFRVDGDLKFLVMEYIKGHTLEEMLDETPDRKLTLDKLLPIAANVAEALDFAHHLQPPILHRDIKPSNIMVDPSGRGKVLDFGIARELKDSMTRLTGKDTSGTLLYMSPEQFTGSTPTTASDVYSFAAMMYECLAGHAPFWQGSIAHQLLNQAPGKVPGLSPQVNAGLMAGLAKNGADRPSSARELVRILEGKAQAGISDAATVAHVPDAADKPQLPAAAQKTKLRKRKAADESVPGMGEGGRHRGLKVAAVLLLVIGAGAVGVWRQWWPDSVLSVFGVGAKLVEAAGPTVDDVVKYREDAEAKRMTLDSVEADPNVTRMIAAVDLKLDGAAEAARKGEYADSINKYKEAIARCEVVLQKDGDRKLASTLRGEVLAAITVARGAKAPELAAGDWAQGEKFNKTGEVEFEEGEFAEAGRTWRSARSHYEKAAQLAIFSVKVGEAKKLYADALAGALKQIELPDLKQYGREEWRVTNAAVGEAESAGFTRKGVDKWKEAAASLAKALPKAVAERDRVAAIGAHMAKAVTCLDAGKFDEAVLSVKGALSLREDYQPAIMLQRTIEGAQLLVGAEAVRRDNPQNSLAAVDKALASLHVVLETDPQDIRALKLKQQAQAMKKELLGLFRPDKKLIGHGEWVKSLAIRPGGKYVASGSKDDSVKLWDLDSGKCVRTISQTGDVEAVAFSPDGKTLIWTVGAEVKLLDLDTPDSKAVELKGHIIAVLSVAMSSDGSQVATASSDNTAKLWDAKTGKCTATFQHEDDVTCVAFSPGGGKGEKLLATASKDKHIKLWNPADGALKKDLTGHGEKILTVAFSPDGKLLAAGDSDWKIHIWNVADGKFVRTLAGHERAVYCVTFSPDGKLLVSAGGDATIRIWDIASGRNIQTLLGHGKNKQVAAVVFTPDGKQLISCGEDAGIIIWAEGLKQTLRTR